MTTPHRAGCLVCGRDLVYLDAPEEMACSLCGERTRADVRCAAGHFVCDRCHAAGANDLIERVWIATDIAEPHRHRHLGCHRHRVDAAGR